MYYVLEGTVEMNRIRRRTIYLALLVTLLLQGVAVWLGVYSGTRETMRMREQPSAVTSAPIRGDLSYKFLLLPTSDPRYVRGEAVLMVARPNWHSTPCVSEMVQYGHEQGMSNVLPYVGSFPQLGEVPSWSRVRENVGCGGYTGLPWNRLEEVGVGFPFRWLITRSNMTIPTPGETVYAFNPYTSLPILGRDRDELFEVRPWRLAASLTATMGLLFTPALLLAACRALLRRFRRRSGLCARCGYTRGGLAHDAPCPECGEAAPQIRKSVAI
ncbi:MAG: hypothetical protein IPM33_04740 [Phycisphaerales bacterium]|nr:hypothetical protein [Phycisphaerales bacterium]